MKPAEEFLKNFNEEENNIDKLYYDSYVKKAMIQFAKMHVQEALKQASENAESYVVGGLTSEVDKDSILNAYPLDLIK